MLFNLALEKAVRDADIDTRGTIYYKSVQLLAYADDIDIIGRSPKAVKETFSKLEKAAKNMGLKINEKKTKYMEMTNKQSNMNNLIVDTFEKVKEFKYLGTMTTVGNKIDVEINKRLMLANRGYYGLKKQLSSRYLTLQTKTKIYKTILRPIITYGSESWTLTKLHENKLKIFKRKILKRIFGPICENGVWHSRYDDELYLGIQYMVTLM